MICPVVLKQSAHPVTSSVAQGGVFWLPEDVMASPTVTMTLTKPTAVCMRDGTFLEYTSGWLGKGTVLKNVNYSLTAVMIRIEC